MVGRELDDVVRRALSDALSGSPERAVVELWRVFVEDEARFAGAREAWRRDAAGFNAIGGQIAAFLDAEEESDGAWIGNFGADDALAALRAVDEFLYVSHTSRMPRPVAIHVGDHSVHPRAGGITAAAASDPTRAEHWVRRHWVVRMRGGRIEPRWIPWHAPIDDGLRASARSGMLAVFVAACCDEVEITWRHSQRPGWVVATGLSDEEARWCTLRDALALAAAAQSGPVVVVLPAMTVTPGLRDRVRRWLATHRSTIAVVLAGSFHVAVAGDRCAEAWVLDGLGRIVLAQRQLTRTEHVRDDGTPDSCEDIACGTEWLVLPTVAGLLTAVHGTDLAAEGGALGTVAARVGVEIALVAGRGGEQIEPRLRALGEQLGRSHATVTAAAIQPRAVRAEPAMILVISSQGVSNQAFAVTHSGDASCCVVPSIPRRSAV